ncbi:MAG: radical SAM family heme chaperone HemW [Bacillota bacterium]
MDFGVYLHVPFCRQKCNYCDFISFPTEENRYQAYGQGLIAELALYHPAVTGRRAVSVYFGGGTPSLLGPQQLAEILTGIMGLIELVPDAEITMEANPATIEQSQLETLRQAGFNRLSIGAQARQDRLLSFLGRAHNSRDTEITVRAARKAGFANINLDLMYGLPGQSLEDWQDTLNWAVALEPEHLAAYGLKLEEGTLWEDQFKMGLLSLPEEETVLNMHELTIHTLTGAGYLHYEISNFARPGFRSVHNLLYWRNQEYLGLGVAASSHFGSMRWTNTKDLDAYLVMVNSGVLPVGEKESLPPEIEMAETVFLGLRLLEGYHPMDFQHRFGVPFEQVYGSQLAKLMTLGLIEKHRGRFRLTRQGLPLANEAFQKFLLTLP